MNLKKVSGKDSKKPNPYRKVRVRDRVFGGQFYELIVLLRSDMSWQDVHEFLQRLAGKVVVTGGKLHDVSYWGSRNLAYKIQKMKKAHFYCIYLECDTPTQQEISRVLKLSSWVLRHALLRIACLPDVKSPMIVNLDKDIADGVCTHDANFLVDVSKLN